MPVECRWSISHHRRLSDNCWSSCKATLLRKILARSFFLLSLFQVGRGIVPRDVEIGEAVVGRYWIAGFFRGRPQWHAAVPPRRWRAYAHIGSRQDIRKPARGRETHPTSGARDFRERRPTEFSFYRGIAAHNRTVFDRSVTFPGVTAVTPSVTPHLSRLHRLARRGRNGHAVGHYRPRRRAEPSDDAPLLERHWA
jgi:hypothetical protein